MADSSVQVLRDLADVHLGAVLKLLPSDRIGRFILFMDVVRAMDYWGTHAPVLVGNSEKVAQSIDLMYWGWNRTVAELFEPLDQPGGFPLVESTHESSVFAVGLMQEFGKVSLLRRLADMAERGIMEIMRDGDQFQIRMSEDVRAQFADAAESDRLVSARALPSSTAGWTTVSMRDALRFPDMPGNYAATADAPAKRWLKADIHELIKPMVRPWETGRGVMVAYDARSEVDEHYMAEALSLATHWRDSSGIHPDAKLGPITGADLAGVGASLISLHSKHFACVSVAKKMYDHVSVEQSLTIWGPLAELEESLSIMSGRPKSVVHSMLNVLAMTAAQAKKLADYSTPLIPCFLT